MPSGTSGVSGVGAGIGAGVDSDIGGGDGDRAGLEVLGEARFNYSVCVRWCSWVG